MNLMAMEEADGVQKIKGSKYRVEINSCKGHKKFSVCFQIKANMIYIH